MTETITVQNRDDDTLVISRIGQSIELADYISYLYHEESKTTEEIATILNTNGFLTVQHKSYSNGSVSHAYSQIKKTTLTGRKISRHVEVSSDDEAAQRTCEMIFHILAATEVPATYRLDFIRKAVS